MLKREIPLLCIYSNLLGFDLNHGKNGLVCSLQIIASSKVRVKPFHWKGRAKTPLPLRRELGAQDKLLCIFGSVKKWDKNTMSPRI